MRIMPYYGNYLRTYRNMRPWILYDVPVKTFEIRLIDDGCDDKYTGTIVMFTPAYPYK